MAAQRGRFIGLAAVHVLVESVADGEYTLCGIAFDCGTGGDLVGGGDWVDVARGAITCDKCCAVIEEVRALRVRLPPVGRRVDAEAREGEGVEG